MVGRSSRRNECERRGLTGGEHRWGEFMLVCNQIPPAQMAGERVGDALKNFQGGEGAAIPNGVTASAAGQRKSYGPVCKLFSKSLCFRLEARPLIMQISQTASLRQSTRILRAN